MIGFESIICGLIVANLFLLVVNFILYKKKHLNTIMGVIYEPYKWGINGLITRTSV